MTLVTLVKSGGKVKVTYSRSQQRNAKGNDKFRQFA